MRSSPSQSRVTAALAVLALHLALVVGLWQWQAKAGQAEPLRSTLVTLLRPTPPQRAPKAATSAAPAATQAVRARTQPSSPSAVEAPAAPDAPAAQAEAAPTALQGLPAAAAPAASGALNLAMPKGSTAPVGLAGLAQQLSTDPRANSPRPDLGERLFGGTGSTQVIQLAGGGQKIIGPQGECTIVTPNTWGSMNPMDPNARSGPSKVGDCSKSERGARKHKRPP